MRRLYIISVIFLSLYVKAFTQIYTLKNNEKLNKSYILSETNFALIIENNAIDASKTYDILYKNMRLSGYKDSGSIIILPNGTLVATMLKNGLAKDMWTVIYGNIEQEFDSIEREIFSSNNSIIFTRLMGYGVAVINGDAKVQYSELYDSIINENTYAFSYSRDDSYFVYIGGKEIQVSAKAEKLKFSMDGNTIIYVVNNESVSSIYVDETNIGDFSFVDDLAAFNYNNIAYAAKLILDADTNMISSNNIDIITNTSTVTNYNLSNISIYTNEEGVAVKGQSNTIALMTITNVITNIISSQIKDLETMDNVITNEFIMTSIIANGRNYGNFNSITNMSFSPNGKSLAFITLNKNNTMQLYYGGNITTNYNIIYNYKYSLDSKIFVYSARNNGTIFMVLNGKEFPLEYEKINEFYFSTNNNLVYNASKNNREYIVANNFESPSYNKITSFKFLGDNSFAFTTERLGKYYYFILNNDISLRREYGGYEYVSSMNDYQETAISIVSDGENVFIIKDGVIINNIN